MGVGWCCLFVLDAPGKSQAIRRLPYRVKVVDATCVGQTRKLSAHNGVDTRGMSIISSLGRCFCRLGSGRPLWKLFPFPLYRQKPCCYAYGFHVVFLELRAFDAQRDSGKVKAKLRGDDRGDGYFVFFGGILR